MDGNRAALGDAVKHTRNRLGITQEALALRAELARATIQKLERGEPVRPAVLAKVEPALGWAEGSCVALLEGAPEPMQIPPKGKASVIMAVSEDQLNQVISSAMVAVADSMTASEIRDVSRRVTEELKRRGFFGAAAITGRG